MQWITGVDKNPDLAFLPCAGMAFWTVATLARLINARSGAVKSKKVSIKYYRLYDQGGEPEDVAKLSQNVENLFEAPPLFYAAVLVLYLSKGSTATTNVVAWFYVLLRVAHTQVHVNGNNVMHRMYTYAGSTIALATLWGFVLSNIVTKQLAMQQ